MQGINFLEQFYVKMHFKKWTNGLPRLVVPPSQLTGSWRYSGLGACADNLLEPGQALTGGPTVPPTVVWEHKAPYAPRLVVLAQPFPSQIKPGPHFTARYTGEGVGCRWISQKIAYTYAQKQPDWDLNPGLLHHSPVA